MNNERTYLCSHRNPPNTGDDRHEQFTAEARLTVGAVLASDCVKWPLNSACVRVCVLTRGPLTISLRLTRRVCLF